jgi:uncharacterized protein YukE
MAGDMEVDPAAVQAFATFLADAKQQFEQVKARFDEPHATAESFGRHWKGLGDEYVASWGMLAPDLANLSTVLDQITAHLGASAELTIAGETANAGEFTTIESGIESGGDGADGGRPSGSGGV